MGTEIAAYDYEQHGALAGVLQGITNRINTRMKRIAEDIIVIGSELISAKKFLKHGEFGVWLKAEFDWSDETALRYMRVAERFSDIPQIVGFAPSVLYMLASPSVSDEAVEQVIELAADGNRVTLEAAREVIQQHADAIESEVDEAVEVEAVEVLPPPQLFETAIRRPEESNVRDPDEVRSHGIVTSLHELIDAGAKFSAIYADPPWAYSNKATRSAVEDVYKSTMTVDEICAEPVSQLATERCHLHLWTTNAFLFEARRVLEAWGFEYKSCFVWVKSQMGIGNYWRVSHEFMLLGVRGGMTFLDRGQKSWIEQPRTKHSRKPDEVRKIIEKVSPGPYLEMYGRQLPYGEWTVYGNEVEGSLFDESVRGSQRD